MIGGAIAGLIGMFFPEILGLGYGFLQFPIDGNLCAITTNYFTLPVALTLLLMVLLKILATSITVGSGGSGVFGPPLSLAAFSAHCCGWWSTRSSLGSFPHLLHSW